MLIPNDFYYIEKIGDDYTREAPGSLNVSRLIKDQKAWLQPQALAEKRKKKLFLIDETAKNWRQYKAYDVVNALKRLIDEGFEIYIKQGDGFIELNYSNIHLLQHSRFEEIKANHLEDFTKLITTHSKYPQIKSSSWMSIG